MFPQSAQTCLHLRHSRRSDPQYSQRSIACRGDGSGRTRRPVHGARPGGWRGEDATPRAGTPAFDRQGTYPPG